MCAIYGCFNMDYSLSQIQNKINLIKYRGPDNQSIRKISENLYFGHNRLAIIDLDIRSNQPFSYYHVDIVFNGEIYNFLELKKELTDEGFTFRTTSDTEVLCAAYIKYGIQFLEKINGMFAFVIYDHEKKLLIGARDRLGKKPLFYRYRKGELEFCSQISPILKHSTTTINWDNVKEYFFWGYNQDPNTTIEGILKLPAGCYFEYDINKRHFSTKEYWNLSTLSTD